jgi:hypothetical protein
MRDGEFPIGLRTDRPDYGSGMKLAPKRILDSLRKSVMSDMSAVVPPSTTKVWPVIKPAVARAEICRHLCNVERNAETGDWYFLAGIFRGLFDVETRNRFRIVLNGNPARSDGVDAYAAITELHGEGAGAGEDGALGGCVGRVLRRTLQSMDGRKIADGSALAVQHGLDDALCEQIGRSKIHLKQRIEMLRLHFEKGAIKDDAGIINEDIGPAQEVDGCIDHAERTGEVVEVGVQSDGAA